MINKSDQICRKRADSSQSNSKKLEIQDLTGELRKREWTMSTEKQQLEVDRNYEVFRALLPDLLKTDVGRFALMQNREVIACFDTSRDAMQAGRKLLEVKTIGMLQNMVRKLLFMSYLHNSSISELVMQHEKSGEK